MAETALADPEVRGTLVIADRVVERVAVLTARETPGVADVGSALEGAIGRRYPKADAEVAGDRVRLTVELAVIWPSSLADVTARVRTAVHDRIEQIVGLHVDSVDVTAAKVVHARPEPRQRVQ